LFVRWQTYRSQAKDRSQRARNNKQARMRAILVESVRIDGQPRQQHVAFLGSTSIDGSDRPRFWRSVTTKLNSMRRLSPQDRKDIAASIAKKVPGQLLTKAELAASKRSLQALTRSLRGLS
jgi:hypothetical protein